MAGKLISYFKKMSPFSTNKAIRDWKVFTFMVFPLLLFGCNVFDSDNTVTNFEYYFSESEHNWESFFTDFFVGRKDKMELTSDYRSLPYPLNTNKKALYISGTNTSDDLKMLFRKKVDGLEANTTYRVNTTIRFATEEPSGCAGIGGAPGEAVKVISAASSVKPKPIISGNENDYYRLNIQHEGDSKEWYQNRIMGNIANSRECEQGGQFEIKELKSNSVQDVVKTNKDGETWLLFGTRSGFEGETELYYTYFKAEFKK